MKKKFRASIILFTGFKQNIEARSGFEDGYFQHVAHLQNEKTLVFAPRTWKDDVEAFADQLRRQGVERTALLSYSHGQAAATAFARYAAKVGIEVELWIACDPVYRPTWLPRATWSQIFAFRALMKTGKIKVPRNITRTVYVRQEKDMPRGHTLVPETDRQIVELLGVFHSYGHTEIDESDEFWEIVNDELSRWINPPKAIPLPE